jgi:hypothetical protein
MANIYNYTKVVGSQPFQAANFIEGYLSKRRLVDRVGIVNLTFLFSLYIRIYIKIETPLGHYFSNSVLF